MSGKTDAGDLTLSPELLERVETRVQHTEFDSVDEYVEYVLAEVLHHVETDAADDETMDVDESEVQDRLESLGYLNG